MMFKKYNQEHFLKFKKIFGLNLKDFWDVYTGFDIIGFDEWIGDETENGKSCKDVVKERYGEDGVKLIRSLI